MSHYLDCVKDFLKVRDDPEDDPTQNPKKLLHYVEQFESLRQQFDTINPTLDDYEWKNQWKDRFECAAKWCRREVEILRGEELRKQTRERSVRFNAQPAPTEKKGCPLQILVVLLILSAVERVILFAVEPY